MREEPENDFLAHNLSLGGRESPDVKMVEPCEPTTEERDELLVGVLIHLCVHLNQKYIKYSQLHQHIPPFSNRVGKQETEVQCLHSETMHTHVGHSQQAQSK